MSHSKILRHAVLVAGGGALFGLASSHDNLFGHSHSITSCAAGNGGPHSALRRRSTVGALADVKLRTTMAEERINALRAEMRSIETRIAAAERDIGLSAPKTAALASPMRFRTLLEQRATHTLRELDCTSLVTRLVVRSESDFAMQLADRAGTALNSKQVVFVTPASSWIEWLEKQPAAPAAVSAADALDFVGWSEGDIEWARSANLSAKIYVWRAAANGADLAPATWDELFDTVLPACAADALAFAPPNGKFPAAWWHMGDAAENERFVALARQHRRSIMALKPGDFARDKTVGVREALAAAPAEQPRKVRQALQNILYLEELYAGDGYTYNKAGAKKAPEMLVKTQRLVNLEDLEVIDLGQV
eukprot:g1164.t1